MKSEPFFRHVPGMHSDAIPSLYTSKHPGVTDVEATLWLATSASASAELADAIVEWITANGGTARYDGTEFYNPDCCITIDTAEGVLRANSGDWIVRVGDEFYPYKSDLFAKIYGPAPPE